MSSVSRRRSEPIVENGISQRKRNRKRKLRRRDKRQAWHEKKKKNTYVAMKLRRLAGAIGEAAK